MTDTAFTGPTWLATASGHSEEGQAQQDPQKPAAHDCATPRPDPKPANGVSGEDEEYGLGMRGSQRLRRDRNRLNVGAGHNLA